MLTISVSMMNTHTGTNKGGVNPKSMYRIAHSIIAAKSMVKTNPHLCHNPSRIFVEFTVLFATACAKPVIKSKAMNPSAKAVICQSISFPFNRDFVLVIL